METSRSHVTGGSERQKIRIRVRQVYSVRELFPARKIGKSDCPESLILNDSIVPRAELLHARGQAAATAGGSTANQGGRLLLPEWGPRYRTLCHGDVQLAFDPTSPGLYLTAEGEIPPNLRAEWKIVVRPEKGYLVLGGYMNWMDAGKQDVATKCYDVRVESIKEGEGPQQAMLRVFGEAVEDLAKNRCTPMKPATKLTNPALTLYEIKVDEDVFVFKFDLVSWKRSISGETTRWASLPLEKQHLIREILRATPPELRYRRGVKPVLPDHVVREVFAELMPVCVALLGDFADRKWPPFRQRVSAMDHLERRCQGSKQVKAAIAQELISKRRRPSAKSLACRVLSRMTLLSTTRINQLTRKN